MNPRTHALRVGLRRGLREARMSLSSPEDVMFSLVWGGGIFLFLFLNRNTEVDGSTLMLPTLVLPGALALTALLGGVSSTSFFLALEKEDGTLLRARSAPGGLIAYMAGLLVRLTLTAVPAVAVVLLPSLLFIDRLREVPAPRWVALAGLMLLGYLVSIPLGAIAGAVSKRSSNVGAFGVLPLALIALISGIFAPLATQPAWQQWIAQGFPVYWLGSAMRWALLPESAAALEMGGVWHTGQALVVVGAWALALLIITPRVLRRMARHEAGSAVEARKNQRIGSIR